MERSSNEHERPETSADLLPKRLSIAEFLMIPFFWLSPLLVLVLGGAMALDVKQLKGRYDVDFGDIRYVFYLIPFAIGHLGSLVYRTQRRQQILQSRGFESSVLTRIQKERGTTQNYLLAGWFLFQLFALLSLAIVPLGMTGADLLAVAVLALFAGNVVVGPALVWWDLRMVRDVENVSWGWTGYLHVLVSALPFATFLYLVQRMAHVQCAVIVELWDEDPEDYLIPESEKGTLERVNDRIESVFS